MKTFKPFVFSPSDQSKILVNTAQKSRKKLNRLLFGKFSEHLGSNIYKGLWAQILQNSIFASWDYFHVFYLDMVKWKGHIKTRYKHFPIARMIEAYESGIACWWMSYGQRNADYLLNSQNPLSSETCQQIIIPNIGEETGIEQAIHLPAHRINDYELTFYARGDVSQLQISLTMKGKVLCQTEVTGLLQRWQQYKVKLSIPEKSVKKGELVNFRIGCTEAGCLNLDNIELFPADNISGFDFDVIKFIKDSNISIYRFPGGNFVSAYCWKDGIGPREKRPLRQNLAWGKVIESNHVGTDEHLEFCRLIGAEPLICINAGNASPQDAAQWVEYCNGGLGTEFGRKRAENGHPEPYNVKYWEIGNELYGKWQIGHCSSAEYAERYDIFRQTMLAVDPSLKLIANGQDLAWNKTIVERKGDIIDSLSIHLLEGVENFRSLEPDDVFLAYMEMTTDLDRRLQKLSQQASSRIKNPYFAVTELQIFSNRAELANNKTLSEALYLAGTIHSAVRNEEIVQLITHSALINHGGGLGKRAEIVYPDPVHWTSHLYGNLPPATPVETQVCGPSFSSKLKHLPKDSNSPFLDVLSLITEDEKTLILLVINRHPHEKLTTAVSLKDFIPSEAAETAIITSETYMDINSLDQADNVQIERSEIKIQGKDFSFDFPKHSITVIYLLLH